MKYIMKIMVRNLHSSGVEAYVERFGKKPAAVGFAFRIFERGSYSYYRSKTEYFIPAHRIELVTVEEDTKETTNA